MRVISLIAIILALVIGVVGAILYFEKKDRDLHKSLIGLCVSMPPLENVRVLGLNAKSAGRTTTYYYRISQTDSGTVSEVDEPVEHIVGKTIVPCNEQDAP